MHLVSQPFDSQLFQLMCHLVHEFLANSNRNMTQFRKSNFHDHRLEIVLPLSTQDLKIDEHEFGE